MDKNSLRSGEEVFNAEAVEDVEKWSLFEATQEAKRSLLKSQIAINKNSKGAGNVR